MRSLIIGKAVVIVAACVLGSPCGSAVAQDIFPGIDAFDIAPGTVLDFTTIPIPADFFEPGSEPFDGIVALQSASLDPMVPGPRFLRPDPGLFTGDPSTTLIPVEMVSLRLQSTLPIVIQSPMGDAFFDVFVGLDVSASGLGQLALARDDGLPSPGGMIQRDVPGSDFAVDSFFDVTYRIEFHETCGCSALMMQPTLDRLDLAGDAPWSEEAPFDRMVFPETSKFFPGGDPMNLAGPPAPLLFDGERLDLALSLMGDPHLPSIMGDADYDLDVDLDDFVILKQNFGVVTGATWAMADFNLDGGVDLDDFVILKNHFGTAPLPEPLTVTLMALGGVALLRRRR